jgi:hypothetical protein
VPRDKFNNPVPAVNKDAFLLKGSTKVEEEGDKRLFIELMPSTSRGALVEAHS